MRIQLPKRGHHWLVVIAMMGLPSVASGHALEAKVQVDGEAILIEVGYDDGTPAEQCRVVIRNSAGLVVFEGRTDERGQCRPPKLLAGDYVLEATQAGHRTTVEFKVSGTPQQDSEQQQKREQRPLSSSVPFVLILLLLSWYFSRSKRKSQ